MMRRTYLIILATLLLVAHPGAARACFGVNITTSVLQFPDYDPIGNTHADSELVVEVECFVLNILNAVPTLLTVSLDPAPGGGARTLTRVGGGYTLDYQVYRDPARQLVWGDGSGGAVSVLFEFLSGLLTSTRQVLGYGRIPGGQNVPAGEYRDTVTVVVDF